MHLFLLQVNVRTQDKAQRSATPSVRPRWRPDTLPIEDTCLYYVEQVHRVGPRVPPVATASTRRLGGSQRCLVPRLAHRTSRRCLTKCAWFGILDLCNRMSIVSGDPFVGGQRSQFPLVGVYPSGRGFLGVNNSTLSPEFAFVALSGIPYSQVSGHETGTCAALLVLHPLIWQAPADMIWFLQDCNLEDRVAVPTAQASHYLTLGLLADGASRGRIGCRCFVYVLHRPMLSTHMAAVRWNAGKCDKSVAAGMLPDARKRLVRVDAKSS